MVQVGVPLLTKMSVLENPFCRRIKTMSSALLSSELIASDGLITSSLILKDSTNSPGLKSLVTKEIYPSWWPVEKTSAKTMNESEPPAGMLAARDEPPARKNPAGMERPEVVSGTWPLL